MGKGADPKHRSWLRAVLGLLASVVLLALPNTASAAVIGFDDLDPSGRDGSGLAVNVQYQGQGVTFNDPTAFDYSKGGQFAIPGFVRSPNVAVEPCFAAEFCSTPVRAEFTAPQEDVRVWVGFASPLAAPLGVRLTGFDGSSAVVGTADATLPANPNPTPVSVPLAIDLASPAIRALEVSVTTGGGYTSGLAVDDVEFSTVGPPPPCTAAGPPTIRLDRPKDGLVVDEDAFSLEGSVDPNGAPISSASVRVLSPTERSASIYPTLVSRNGGRFGPTNFSGMLSMGVNDLLVSATNCAGSGTSEPRRVTRTIANAGPGPLACTPQPDHRAVHVATSAADLAAVLNSGFQGQVIAPRGASFDMTGYRYLPLHPGVQLVGERDALGRRPQLYTRDLGGYSLFGTLGPDICVEGLAIVGPSSSPARNQPDTFAITVSEDPAAFAGDPDPVVIADNELYGWPGAAVDVVGTVSWEDREAPPGYDGPRMTREDAPKVRVERNYIHHNARDGGGYGVTIGGSSYVTITGNVFDFNRHAVASGGFSFSGYLARFNYVLEGGYKYGSGYYGSHFDVHGTGSGSPHWVGGGAGEYHEIAFNTIRGDQRYHCKVNSSLCKVRGGLALRGRPSDSMDWVGNVLVHSKDDAVVLKKGDDDRLSPLIPSTFNLRSRGNDHNADRSGEIAAGDFDGDGRTDVFLSNGTGWFISRAGIRPWEFLRPSDKLVRDLGFADIDNDGATDVIHRDGAGNLGYVKSGAAPDLTPLTRSPVPVRDLRFGDFDGDGLTDIFRTRDRQWHVWYGRTGAWTPTQTSAQPISGLLFGEFDGVGGTDVAAVTKDAWSYSSGATTPWRKLNDKLKSPFSGAVAADFDGNGATDIAFGDKDPWRYSPNGSAPFARLRRADPSDRPLHKLLVGNFDGEPRATVVGYGPRDHKVFGLWRGLGAQSSFVKLSEQRMR